MVVDQLHPLFLAVSFKVPSFLVEFITLIIKATRGQTTELFFIVREYEKQRKNLGTSVSSWTIKYCKGLETSTTKEGRKYFEDITGHKKDLMCEPY